MRQVLQYAASAGAFLALAHPGRARAPFPRCTSGHSALGSDSVVHVTYDVIDWRYGRGRGRALAGGAGGGRGRRGGAGRLCGRHGHARSTNPCGGNRGTGINSGIGGICARGGRIDVVVVAGLHSSCECGGRGDRVRGERRASTLQAGGNYANRPRVHRGGACALCDRAAQLAQRLHDLTQGAPGGVRRPRGRAGHQRAARA